LLTSTEIQTRSSTVMLDMVRFNNSYSNSL
jgi:hypothetical protein